MKWQDRPVAGRYARALFAGASSAKAVDAVRSDLGRLAQALAAVPALEEVLRHPRVSAMEKAAILQRSLGQWHPVTERWVGVLLEKKRWEAWRDIRPIFERLADEAAGVLTVRAETPKALNDEEMTALRRALEKAWGGPVSLECRAREELLGGVVLRVGDRVWDNSLRGQVDRLREVWNASAAS